MATFWGISACLAPTGYRNFSPSPLAFTGLLALRLWPISSIILQSGPLGTCVTHAASEAHPRGGVARVLVYAACGHGHDAAVVAVVERRLLMPNRRPALLCTPATC